MFAILIGANGAGKHLPGGNQQTWLNTFAQNYLLVLPASGAGPDSAGPDGSLTADYSASAVVFFTVRSTSIEFERATPGSRISTSVWKRSRSSASRYAKRSR